MNKGRDGKKKEWLYWTDKVAGNVRDRVEKSEVLKKIVKDRGYIVYDEKTPSGRIHIGSARGWIIHDTLAKSMRDNGMIRLVIRCNIVPNHSRNRI